MGIIGVVAALTIPNVNKNTNEAEKVAKVKKIYAELNEAHNRATAVYGPLNTWFYNDSISIDDDEDGQSCFNLHARYFNRLTEFMKLQKNCGCDDYCESSTTGCMFDGYYKDVHGRDISKIDTTEFPRAIAAGNWSFCIIEFHKALPFKSFYGYPINKSAGFLYVDIDGPNKGKNSMGIDMFAFTITSDGIYPQGGGTEWTDSTIHTCASAGYYCTEWVIRNGNMDYLDADANGKCKHSNKTLSTTVSSCK